MSAEFRLNHWLVKPHQSRLVRADNPEHQVRIDPKAMQVLVCLADHLGEVVPKERIIDSVWEGTFVTDEVLTNAIWELRKALGDDAKSPRYIQTIPRKGYRLIVENLATDERVLPRWTRFILPVSRHAAVRGAMLALVVLAIAWGLWRFRPSPVKPTSPAVVAVLPFSVRGSEEFAYLGEGMVDLLGTTLNTESQRVVDPKTLLRHIEREGEELLDPERARLVAERFGAGRYVLGSVVASGGRLRIQSNLHDTALGGEVIAQAFSEGSGDEVFSLVDDLTTQLLVGEYPGPGGHFPRVAAMTTESLEALKAYLEGEKTMRAGSFDLDKAYQAFQRAVELDPTFALAWYRLAVAAGFGWDTEPTYEYLEEALRQADRLSERDRLRLQAADSLLHSRPEEAEPLYEELLAKYPDDAEGWALLSQILHFFDWRTGRLFEDTAKRSHEYSKRAQALDPSSFDAAFILYYDYLNQRRFDEAERQARIIFGERPLPVETRAQLALGRGDQRAWEQVLPDLRNAGGTANPRGFLWTTAMAPDHPDRVREFIEALYLQESRTPGQIAGGHITLAVCAAAWGRWAEAKKELAASEPYYPAAALEHGAILCLAPFLEVPREDLASIRDKLSRWDPKSGRPRPDFPYPPGLPPVLRPYLLGHLSARLGEEVTALRYAAELERNPAPELMPSMPSDLAGSVRAQVALNEGRLQDALALLEQARMDVHPSRYFNYPLFVFTTYTHERFLRAELLHQLGRDEEALGWYAGFGIAPSFAYAHFRMGEIREKQGDVKKAIKHYDLFTRFWRDCDPQLRPVLEEAKRRLERLREANGG